MTDENPKPGSSKFDTLDVDPNDPFDVGGSCESMDDDDDDNVRPFKYFFLFETWVCFLLGCTI